MAQVTRNDNVNSGAATQRTERRPQTENRGNQARAVAENQRRQRADETEQRRTPESVQTQRGQNVNNRI